MSARDVLIKRGKQDIWLNPEERADAILSALSAMPLASRLALARALVPGWAVVPVEPSRQMMECAVVRHYNKGSLAEVWTAMLTAAEEPPHGP